MKKRSKEKKDEFNMQPVESSNIKAIGYKEGTETCRVEFHSGGTYDYHPFPKPLFKAMEIAKSKGEFLSKYVRGNKVIESKKL